TRGARSQDTTGRYRVASLPPVLRRPLDRRGPLRLHVRPGRTVVEAVVQLPPVPLVGDPGERFGGLRGITRDRLHGRTDLTVGTGRIVASHPFVPGTSQVEGGGELVGVRARPWIHDGMSPVDQCELRAVPGGPLGS